jgi:hypothetical protein
MMHKAMNCMPLVRHSRSQKALVLAPMYEVVAEADPLIRIFSRPHGIVLDTSALWAGCQVSGSDHSYGPESGPVLMWPGTGTNEETRYPQLRAQLECMVSVRLAALSVSQITRVTRRVALYVDASLLLSCDWPWEAGGPHY